MVTLPPSSGPVWVDCCCPHFTDVETEASEAQVIQLVSSRVRTDASRACSWNSCPPLCSADDGCVQRKWPQGQARADRVVADTWGDNAWTHPIRFRVNSSSPTTTCSVFQCKHYHRFKSINPVQKTESPQVPQGWGPSAYVPGASRLCFVHTVGLERGCSFHVMYCPWPASAPRGRAERS